MGGSAATEALGLRAEDFAHREFLVQTRADMLILLGLEPRVEESNGGNGRWYRVYVGPFESRSKMAKARRLTTAENIETLLLKRGQSQ